MSGRKKHPDRFFENTGDDRKKAGELNDQLSGF